MAVEEWLNLMEILRWLERMETRRILQVIMMIHLSKTMPTLPFWYEHIVMMGLSKGLQDDPLIPLNKGVASVLLPAN